MIVSSWQVGNLAAYQNVVHAVTMPDDGADVQRWAWLDPTFLPYSLAHTSIVGTLAEVSLFKC